MAPSVLCGMSHNENLDLFQVFDHDWGMNDDFIGEAILEISSLELEKYTLFLLLYFTLIN